MASGIRGSCNRPKRPKHLKSTKSRKKYAQLSGDGLANYQKKLIERANRKIKKKNRRK